MGQEVSKTYLYYKGFYSIRTIIINLEVNK